MKATEVIRQEEVCRDLGHYVHNLNLDLSEHQEVFRGALRRHMSLMEGKKERV